VLSAVPVLCVVPVEDETVWLVPVVSDVLSVQPCDALTSPLTIPGMPAPTLAPTVLLCDELALEDWLAPSDVPWLCELPVELLSVCPVAEPALTVTPLPVDCDAPAESVWLLPEDQPLDEPSEVPQLVPSVCAVPVDWLSVWEPESVWLELSVCEPLSVWLALSVCEPESVWLELSVWAPDAVWATLSVWPQPVLAVTPWDEPTESVTDELSVWDVPWLWLSPTAWPQDCDSLSLHPSLMVSAWL